MRSSKLNVATPAMRAFCRRAMSSHHRGSWFSLATAIVSAAAATGADGRRACAAAVMVSRASARVRSRACSVVVMVVRSMVPSGASEAV
jgi:hypothetical protein